jgi:plasmid replication initiation protein
MVFADQSRPDGRLCAAKTMEAQSLSRADPSSLASGASDRRIAGLGFTGSTAQARKLS